MSQGYRSRFSYNARKIAFIMMPLLFLSLHISGCVHERKSNLVVDKERRVDIAIKAATEYLRLGDLDSAHRHLIRALEIEPRNASAHNVLALLYLQEGDVEKTERNYKKAIKYDKAFAPALNNYGAFLYSQGRYEEALQYLNTAAVDVSYDKRHQAYQNLGLVALELGDEETAIDAFQNALRLENKSSKASLELASIYLKRKKYKIANRYYKAFLNESKQSSRSLWLGIQIARGIGNKDAEASYELALKNLFPRSLEFKQYKDHDSQ